MDSRMERVIHDSGWPEVLVINSYALFMGYLSMAIRGVGFLVVLWTTVVLLGGFVSMLQKKDFWCLTIITLLQMTGIYDVSTNQKLSYIWKSYYGFLGTIYAMFVKSVGKPRNLSCKRRTVIFVAWLVQVMLVMAILCPLAVLYMCGLLITAGLSVWRLVQRDYGEAGGSGTNLLPHALDVLYSLAAFQGVLFCYLFTSRFAGGRLATRVAELYKFDEPARDSLDKYLKKTRVGCEKDPSFVKGRNLVTYAVARMDPMSPSSSKKFLSGARILDALLDYPLLALHGQHALIKQLVSPASESPTLLLHKLLHVLDHSYSYEDADTKRCAARIVKHLADNLRLEQFPRGIHCIASLLEEAEAPQLQEEGLAILEKLATDEHNCRVISDAPGVLSKIMAPVSSDMLHRVDHGALHTVVEGSLKVMCRLVTAPGQTGINLRMAIATIKQAVGSMQMILSCNKCGDQMPTGSILAIKILTHLPLVNDASSNDQNRQRLITNLLVTSFTDKNKHISTRELACEELAMLLLSDHSESIAMTILKASDNVVHHLAKVILDDERGTYRLVKAGEILKATDTDALLNDLSEKGLLNVRQVDEMKIEKVSHDAYISRYIRELLLQLEVERCTYRISATRILEHLCNYYYTMDDDCRNKLKKAMTDLMPNVLGELLQRGSTAGAQKQTEETQGKSKCKGKFSSQDADLGEGPAGSVSQDVAQSNNTSSFQPENEHPVNSKLRAVFSSLCAVIFDRLISEQQDLPLLLFFTISPGDSVLSFVVKLRKMVERNSQPMANCLSVVKSTTKMVISMMEHKSRYAKEELENFQKLIESLSSASQKMLGLEGFMLSATAHHGVEKPVRTLASLVEKAQELLNKRKEGELSVVSVKGR